MRIFQKYKEGERERERADAVQLIQCARIDRCKIGDHDNTSIYCLKFYYKSEIKQSYKQFWNPSE